MATRKEMEKERKTKKIKKEGDTCRDCWTKRFREDLCAQLNSESTTIRPSEFLNREHKLREDHIKVMREEFNDLYDEIGAIENLAGDIYMGRYNAKGSKVKEY